MWHSELSEDHFLSTAERSQIDAIFARLIPQDPKRGIPGAADADAGEFVDRLLAAAESLYYEIPAWRNLYREGLAALEAETQARHSKGLAELEDAELDALLTDLENGRLTGFPGGVDQATFFKTLWRHCIQGCFADPRWGGNKNKIMWRWYGYLQQPEEVLKS